MSYTIIKKGVAYEMGASADDVGKGDIVRADPGGLEVITEISPIPGSDWNRRITTESGRIVTRVHVLDYGKRVE